MKAPALAAVMGNAASWSTTGSIRICWACIRRRRGPSSWPITPPGSAELLGSPQHDPDVRMRATMASCDAPSLPTGMMRRNENLAASAEVFGLVAAGCDVRVVVTGEWAYAPGAPRHDAIHEHRRSSSGAIGAFPIACGAGLRR
jgi:hypothetical protein